MVPVPRPVAVSALRPDDLLVIRFEFIGLILRSGALERVPGVRTAAVVAHLGCQHIAEEAFHEADDSADTEPLPAPGEQIDARYAGSSRIAVLVPSAVVSFPCTLDTLLRALTEWEPSVVENALPPPAPFNKGDAPPPPDPKVKPKAPEGHETAIEAPLRLVLSHNRRGAWLHAHEPVRSEGGDRTELWHTRLGVRLGSGALPAGGKVYDGRWRHRRGDDGELEVDGLMPEPVVLDRTVRAVWSPDYPVGAPPDPDPDPLAHAVSHPLPTPADRRQLVALTSDFTRAGARKRVVRADRLMLSALGAWLDVDYGAEPPTDAGPTLSVQGWQHRAALGRDFFARVIRKGYLFPLPHRTVKIEIVERKIERRPGAQTPDAVLRYREFYVVRRPELTYPTFNQRHGARRMPLRRTRITTRVTPNLTSVDIADVPTGTAEWLTLGGKPFAFNLVAEDWEGRPVEFSSPLIWVDATIAFETAKMKIVAEEWEGATPDRRRPRLFRQPVAFAPSDVPESTSFEAEWIELGVEIEGEKVLPSKSYEAADAPAYWPVVTAAEVRAPAVERLSANPGALTIALDDGFVETGGMGQGETFARITAGGDIGFTGDRSGGLVTPNMSVDGLSRRYGPVSGLAALESGTFDPASLFEGTDARILGGLDLADIVTAGTSADATAPRLVTRQLDGPTGPRMETRLKWSPEVTSVKPFVAGAATTLSVDAVTVTDLSADGASEMRVTGQLEHFSMDLWGFIKLPFERLKFDAVAGQKPDVGAVVGEATFGGPLAFVNELKDYLGGSGFDDPPSLEVTSEGVRLGFSLELPTVAVGVMSLTNVSFGAGLSLPFTGDPARLRFAFCERERPFSLTIYCFGGGGFFAFACGLDGCEQMEASLEFGASIAIDIGVASGGVHLMAGIYFSWVEDTDTTLLEGYLRMGGELEVLGLISLSLEFNMGLTYESGPAGGKVWGEATLTVEVEVLMFSESVSMTARREMGDPERAYFHEFVPQDVWEQEYLAAFA